MQALRSLPPPLCGPSAIATEANWQSGTQPLAKRPQPCHTNSINQTQTHMETLDLDILNMISDLEADIEVPDFDLDEVLEDA